MKYFLLAVVFTAGIATSFAQECHSSLSGRVVDQNSGSPVMSARIEVIGHSKVTYSDLNGHYSFSHLCDGLIELKVTAHHAQEKILRLRIEGNTIHNLKIDHHLQQLEKIVLIGQSTVRKSKTAQLQTLSEKAISNHSAGTLGEALAQLSGVSILKTGQHIAKPVIQGLSGSRVPVINNGVQLADQEWGADHAPSLDLNSVEKLTVIKGASALQYGGDAVGGIIIAENADIPKTDTLYGKTILSGSSNGRGGAISTALTKSFTSGWYVNLQGTFKKSGDYKAPDYILSNTGHSERDFSVRAGLQKFHYGFDAYYSSFDSHIGILRASSTGNITDLITAINRRQPLYQADFTYALNAPKQTVHHQLARLKFYQIFDRLGKLSLRYSFQNNNRLEYDIRRGNYKNVPAVDLNLKTHQVSAKLELDPPNNSGLTFGVDGAYKNNFADPRTGIKRIIPDYTSYSFGAYGIGHYRFSSHWLTEAGIRYDFTRLDAMKYYSKNQWQKKGYNQLFNNWIVGEYGSKYLVNPVMDYQNISATIGVKYKLNNAYVFRLNYALSNRAPNPSELFSDGLHHSAASLEIGDLSLNSEHANKLSLSFKKQQGDFTFTVAPYVNFINNFINSSPTGVQETIRGAFLRYNYQQADARLLGLDLDLSYRFNAHFSYRGSLSMVDGQEVDSNRPLIGIPATNTRHKFSYTTLDWHQLRLSLTGQAVFTKQQYPNDNFTVKILENGQYHSTLVDISTPPAGYFLTGLEASAVFHPFQHGKMQVRLAVDNLFDVAYRSYLNRLRYYADNMGRSISLQLKFYY